MSKDVGVITPVSVSNEENLVLNKLTGEFLKLKDVQPVTIVEQECKFQTHYNYIPQGGAEVNSGQYIVDDSEYIDFKKLLQRSAKCSKEARDFLSSIPVVDNLGGMDENQLQDVINNNETAVSVDKSDELSTSEVESPTAQETSNLVENSADVVSEAETNGKE